jgi:hypothetical protein
VNIKAAGIVSDVISGDHASVTDARPIYDARGKA